MWTWERRGLLVHDAGPRPTREQAAADLGGLGISSHDQRQGQAVNEGRYDQSLGGREPRSSIIRVGRRRIEVAHRIERGEVVIGAPRRLEWGSCGRAGTVGSEGRSRRPRVTHTE